MAIATSTLLTPLSIDLPPVERRSVMPGGFLAAGGVAGIKASGRPDLALVATVAGPDGARTPAAAAAVFTPNTFAALRGAYSTMSGTVRSRSASRYANAAGDTDASSTGSLLEHVIPSGELSAVARVDRGAARFTSEARASFEGELLTCRRALHVDHDARAARPRGREAGPLQHLSLGRVRTLTAGAPPDRLLARVVGGACIPETPCRVLVWMGAPAAALNVRGTGSATLRGPPVPAHETSGLV